MVIKKMKSDNLPNPTLSLCMIVKNEEKLLPICLESVKSFADEIIVVDTGSSDRTVEIARSFGAKIYYYKWNNDYAAARNESLKYAAGDWILYLDADERISRTDGAKIREIISDKDISGVNVRIVIPQPPGKLIKSFAVEYCRLFRNHPQVKFERAIHEQVLPSIRRLGGKVLRSDIVIDDHCGAKKEKRQTRNQRNLEFLRAEARAAPSDSFVRYNLAMTYHSMGNNQATIRELNQVLARDNGTLEKELIATAYVFLAQAYLGEGDYIKSLENSLHATGMLPDEPFPCYLAAAAAFKKGELEKAIEQLTRIMYIIETRNGASCMTEVDLSQVYLQLGNCYYLMQRLQAAEDNYQLALERNPESWEINFKLGCCHFKNGQLSSAQQLFERALQLNPDSANQQMLKLLIERSKAIL